MGWINKDCGVNSVEHDSSHPGHQDVRAHRRTPCPAWLREPNYRDEPAKVTNTIAISQKLAQGYSLALAECYFPDPKILAVSKLLSHPHVCSSRMDADDDEDASFPHHGCGPRRPTPTPGQNKWSMAPYDGSRMWVYWEAIWSFSIMRCV